MSDSIERHHRFLAFLHPLQGELEGYARKMLWEPQESADALQNAVLRAYAAFDRYREDASFRGWIYRILTNEIHALNRRHGRRAKYEFQLDPAELAELAGAGEEVESFRWSEQVDDRLNLALRSLPENERTVLVMRGVSGLPYHEIAEALEMPLGNVMGYLSRARTKMRAVLSGSDLSRRKTQ